MNDQQIEDVADDGITVFVSWSKEGRDHRDRVAARLRVIADRLDASYELSTRHYTNHGEVTA